MGSLPHVLHTPDGAVGHAAVRPTGWRARMATSLCLAATLFGAAQAAPAGHCLPPCIPAAAAPLAGAATDGTPWRHWRGVLFRVTPPTTAGQPAPASYLLGTLHFGSLTELGLDDAALQRLLDDVRLFIDEAPAAPAHWPPHLEAYRTLPANQPLHRLLGAASFASLQQLLPAWPAATLQRMKPWAALALLESRGEVVGDHTLDRQLARWVQARGLPAVHLEPLEEQLQALDCVPARDHVQVLQQRLVTPWLFQEQAARVLDFYRAGDLPAWLDEIDALTGLDDVASRFEQQARLCLIETRNARWLAQLDPLLRATSAFVAVGAIHLTGPAGLLASLQQRGYAIAAQPLSPREPSDSTDP